MGSLLFDTAAALSEGSDKCIGRKYIGAFATNAMCSRGAILTVGGRHRIERVVEHPRGEREDREHCDG